jgi:hypothetical protein
MLGFRLFVRCRLVAVWWMATKRRVCFIIAFHIFATLENWDTYRCPSYWPFVIAMKKKLAGTWKTNIGYWPVQIDGNKFATGQILRKPVEVVKGWTLAGWAQKSPGPWTVPHPFDYYMCLHGLPSHIQQLISIVRKKSRVKNQGLRMLPSPMGRSKVAHVILIFPNDAKSSEMLAS